MKLEMANEKRRTRDGEREAVNDKRRTRDDKRKISGTNVRKPRATFTVRVSFTFTFLVSHDEYDMRMRECANIGSASRFLFLS